MDNARWLLSLVSVISLVFGGWVFSGCNEKAAVYQPAVAMLIEKSAALKAANQLAPAICRLEAAADLAPESYPVQYNLGTLYSQAEQWQSAIEHINKALAIHPGQPNALYTLGYSYQGLGDKYLSESAAADTRPANPKAESQAVEAYQNAITAYQQFLKTAPAQDQARSDVEAMVTHLQSKLADKQAS